jgi:hypothetical protein
MSVGVGLAHGGEDAVQRHAVVPVAVQRQRGRGDRLTARRRCAGALVRPITLIRESELPTLSCQKRAAGSCWQGFGTGERPVSN